VTSRNLRVSVKSALSAEQPLAQRFEHVPEIDAERLQTVEQRSLQRELDRGCVLKASSVTEIVRFSSSGGAPVEQGSKQVRAALALGGRTAEVVVQGTRAGTGPLPSAARRI
jgi:hypothetical protein